MAKASVCSRSCSAVYPNVQRRSIAIQLMPESCDIPLIKDIDTRSALSSPEFKKAPYWARAMKSKMIQCSNMSIKQTTRLNRTRQTAEFNEEHRIVPHSVPLKSFRNAVAVADCFQSETDKTSKIQPRDFLVTEPKECMRAFNDEKMRTKKTKVIQCTLDSDGMQCCLTNNTENQIEKDSTRCSVVPVQNAQMNYECPNFEYVKTFMEAPTCRFYTNTDFRSGRILDNGNANFPFIARRESRRGYVPRVAGFADDQKQKLYYPRQNQTKDQTGTNTGFPSGDVAVKSLTRLTRDCEFPVVSCDDHDHQEMQMKQMVPDSLNQELNQRLTHWPVEPSQERIYSCIDNFEERGNAMRDVLKGEESLSNVHGLQQQRKCWLPMTGAHAQQYRTSNGQESLWDKNESDEKFSINDAFHRMRLRTGNQQKLEGDSQRQQSRRESSRGSGRQQEERPNNLQSEQKSKDKQELPMDDLIQIAIQLLNEQQLEIGYMQPKTGKQQEEPKCGYQQLLGQQFGDEQSLKQQEVAKCGYQGYGQLLGEQFGDEQSLKQQEAAKCGYQGYGQLLGQQFEDEQSLKQQEAAKCGYQGYGQLLGQQFGDKQSLKQQEAPKCGSQGYGQQLGQQFGDKQSLKQQEAAKCGYQGYGQLLRQQFGDKQSLKQQEAAKCGYQGYGQLLGQQFGDKQSLKQQEAAKCGYQGYGQQLGQQFGDILSLKQQKAAKCGYQGYGQLLGQQFGDKQSLKQQDAAKCGCQGYGELLGQQFGDKQSLKEQDAAECGCQGYGELLGQQFGDKQSLKEQEAAKCGLGGFGQPLKQNINDTHEFQPGIPKLVAIRMNWGLEEFGQMSSTSTDRFDGEL
ncbi:unnamed protein product [Cyprideis torosa]|uniref:Uncharacterized protein n=1 Tax=Cyprideis torosa TaxID=163714 RepID=A0A7R8W882_9CRUS|nr:unnamed protein product [Cyprideis torosa]CAG0888324.1 unnamed protein product [Cyprideis torosa]